MAKRWPQLKFGIFDAKRGGTFGQLPKARGTAPSWNLFERPVNAGTRWEMRSLTQYRKGASGAKVRRRRRRR